MGQQLNWSQNAFSQKDWQIIGFTPASVEFEEIGHLVLQ
jgi:hypothetical protein